MTLATKTAPNAETQTEHPAVTDMVRTGAYAFPAPVDPEAAHRLLQGIRAARPVDETLFLSEAEFDADPRYRGVNPQPGRNLLERFPDALGFVEASPMITGVLDAVLGHGYRLLDKKVVCGVPASIIPPWLQTRIEGAPVNNLGPYVRPAFRDVTYFYGIDFHQDLIDFKDREADFLTLYVYLHPVGENDAPLYLLEGSHALGGTVFPHDLVRSGEDTWRYGDRRGRAVTVHQRVLTGPAGYAALWHACTLHGTQPHAADRARFSLRYLLERCVGAEAGIDRINAALGGPLSLADTRFDLAENGSAAVKDNIINRLRTPVA
jgi:hypothetical protein